MIPWSPKGQKWTQTTSPSAQGEQRDMQTLPKEFKVENLFSSNKFNVLLEVPRKSSRFSVRFLGVMWDQFAAQGDAGERCDVHKGNHARSQGSTPSPSPFHGSHSPWSTGIKPSLLFLQICWENNPCLWRHLATTWLNCAGDPGEIFLHFSSFPGEQMLLDGLQPNTVENTTLCCEVTVFFHIYLYLGAPKEKLKQQSRFQASSSSSCHAQVSTWVVLQVLLFPSMYFRGSKQIISVLREISEQIQGWSLLSKTHQYPFSSLKMKEAGEFQNER